jgi:hypothetical protein
MTDQLTGADIIRRIQLNLNLIEIVEFSERLAEAVRELQVFWKSTAHR